jgi:hypothetical protein
MSYQPPGTDICIIFSHLWWGDASHRLFIYLISLLCHTLDIYIYIMPCHALHVYVCEWMNSLGMSGVTLMRSWCIWLFNRKRANLTRSWIEGLGCVSWHTLRSTCGGYNFLFTWLRSWGTHNGCSCRPLRWRRMWRRCLLRQLRIGWE